MKIPNPFIFKEYDIRGIADAHLPDNLVFALGKAFGTIIIRQGKHIITIGRDCRLTSERLYAALSRGIAATGCHVYNLGICTTSMLYFSTYHYGSDGAVMITGSHNAADYNGFKICIGHDTIHGQAIKELQAMIEKDDYVTGEGPIEDTPIDSAYYAYMQENCLLARSLKVVVDAGNGVAGTFAVPIFEQLGCEVIAQFCDMNGHFPHHHPDPTIPKNLEALSHRVCVEKADIGIAFDGDGDRIGVVDEQGTIIWGDSLMILYAQEILSRQPHAVFISEVKCSQNMYNAIHNMGGKTIMWKTGHSLIKAKMKETHAALAGELTGHMFFKDRYFGFDDAIYAGFRILEILAKSTKPLSALLQHIPQTYVTPEIRCECPDTIKFTVVNQVMKHFKNKGNTVLDIDGVRVEYSDGWGLMRASNTQPAIVMRFEALTQVRLNELEREFHTLLHTYMKENT